MASRVPSTAATIMFDECKNALGKYFFGRFRIDQDVKDGRKQDPGECIGNDLTTLNRAMALPSKPPSLIANLAANTPMRIPNRASGIPSSSKCFRRK